MYDIEDLVRVAKRENNSIRSYLYVNPLQGKHIPIEPFGVKNLCRDLSDMINDRYIGEKLFVIGFAETATAIATFVASELNSVVYYENTTREMEGKTSDFIYFTESHSHATEQKLNILDYKSVYEITDRIIFVEDEVTTGNTICKLINEIKKLYPERNFRFTIASILNSMKDERLMELRGIGIDCIYVKRIPFEYKKDELDYMYTDVNTSQYAYDYMDEYSIDGVEIYQFEGMMNLRRASNMEDYRYKLHSLCEFVYHNERRGYSYENLLVIGTEEFMHQAIEVADYLKEYNIASNVKTHSTTRSPILVSKQGNYPLNKRYKLRSLYDDQRITYIYNLARYDKVIVITDSKLESEKGLENLVAALRNEGNDNISVYQWRY